MLTAGSCSASPQAAAPLVSSFLHHTQVGGQDQLALRPLLHEPRVRRWQVQTALEALDIWKFGNWGVGFIGLGKQNMVLRPFLAFTHLLGNERHLTNKSEQPYRLLLSFQVGARDGSVFVLSPQPGVQGQPL